MASSWPILCPSASTTSWPRQSRMFSASNMPALLLVGPDVERHHIGVGAGGRPPAARALPVGLLAQQRLPEPVELGDHLLRRPSYGFLGPFAELLQLPGHLLLDLRGNLVLGQGVHLTLRFADRGPQIFGGGVGLADHLAALADRRLQPVGFAHGFPLSLVCWIGVVPSLGRWPTRAQRGGVPYRPLASPGRPRASRLPGRWHQAP